MVANQIKNKNLLAKPPARKAGVVKRLWWVLPAAAAIILVLSVSWFKSGQGKISEKNLSTFTVRREDLTITVTESGSINARNAIDIKSEVEGQATIISIVPEGTYITSEDVNNGKVLVELDSSNLTEQLAQKEIDLASAEAGYAEAKEAYQIQLKQNESDITQAQLAVKFGLMDFQKYLGKTVANEIIADVNENGLSGINIASFLNHPKLAGEALQERRKRQDTIKLNESKLARAQDQLAGTRKLFEKKYVAETELRGDELEVESLIIQKQQADTALELFEKYEFAKQSEKLLSDYYEAKRELDRTHAKARSRLAQAGAKLKSAESHYKLRISRVDKLNKQIEACVIKAPAPGLVVYSSSSNPWMRRDRPIEAGSNVHERQHIMSLPDTAEMVAEISVHESSVDKVQPGQSAKIIIEAFPDQTFTGKVLSVAPLPDPQHAFLNPDLKVYSTKVSIAGSHDFLKPGMSARVEVLVNRIEDCLFVPIQAVTNRAGRKVVYCLASDNIKPRVVETGAFNNAFVQITSGLQAGDRVLLNPPRLTKKTAALAAARPQGAPQQSKEQDQQAREIQQKQREKAALQHRAEETKVKTRKDDNAGNKTNSSADY